MKKAYVIMAHKNPPQLYRLVSRLNDGTSEFFIHIDKTADISPFEKVKEFGNVIHFVDRVDSRWGGFGSVQASLNGLKAVRNTKKNFDHVFLLSGQDYPIKSNEYIDDFLHKSPHAAFVEYHPIPDYAKWPGTDRGGWYRIDKYYIGLKWHEFLRSKTLNFLSAYLPFLRRKIPNNMKPFAGSAWWSVDMYVLNYILDYNEKHAEYDAFHQYTFVPDELFIHMIIANSSDEKLQKRVENDNRRLIIWEKSDNPHPNTLRVTDFDTILASEQLFARKFDEKADTEILDLIDREILFKSSIPEKQNSSGI